MFFTERLKVEFNRIVNINRGQNDEGFDYTGIVVKAGETEYAFFRFFDCRPLQVRQLETILRFVDCEKMEVRVITMGGGIYAIGHPVKDEFILTAGEDNPGTIRSQKEALQILEAYLKEQEECRFRYR